MIQCGRGRMIGVAAYCGCVSDESKIAERFAGVGPELNEC